MHDEDVYKSRGLNRSVASRCRRYRLTTTNWRGSMLFAARYRTTGIVELGCLLHVVQKASTESGRSPVLDIRDRVS